MQVKEERKGSQMRDDNEGKRSHSTSETDGSQNPLVPQSRFQDSAFMTSC